MISENQKISQRQFGRMVVMDWGGGRLLPRHRTETLRRSYMPHSHTRPGHGRRYSCAGRSGR